MARWPRGPAGCCGDSFKSSSRPRLLSGLPKAPILEVGKPDMPSTAPNIEDLWRDLHGELLAFARPRVASGSEAEDILQDTFLRAHRQLAAGAAPTNPRSWLYQIVRNLVVDTYRLNARRSEISGPVDKF